MQLTNRVSSWLISLKYRGVELLSLMLLVSWASLLTVYTVKLQHSCHPLLERTDISTRECPSEVSKGAGKSQDSDKSQGGDQEETGKEDSLSNNSSSKDHSRVGEGRDPDRGGEDRNPVVVKEIVVGAAASIAVVGLAVIGAPVAIAAGVGVAVWWAARTLITFGS